MNETDRDLCERVAKRLGWECEKLDLLVEFGFKDPVQGCAHGHFDPADPLADLEASGRVLEAAFPDGWELVRTHWRATEFAVHFEDEDFRDHWQRDPNPLRAAMKLVLAAPEVGDA